MVNVKPTEYYNVLLIHCSLQSEYTFHECLHIEGPNSLLSTNIVTHGRTPRSYYLMDMKRTLYIYII